MVRSRSPLSEDALDRRFIHPDGKGRLSGELPHVFKRIRRDGSDPRGGTEGGHPFDLVSKIDADSLFTGTAAHYDSPFWVVMRDPRMDGEPLYATVEEQLHRAGLRRAGIVEDMFLEATIQTPASDRLTDVLAAPRFTCTLDRLALLAVLHRQAIIEREDAIADRIDRLHLEATDDFSNEVALWRSLNHIAPHRIAVDRTKIDIALASINFRKSSLGLRPRSLAQRALVPL